MDQKDIYRAAKAMVDRYGDRAPIEAALRADAMLEEGNSEGYYLWLLIKAAAESLLNTDPSSAH